MILQDKVIMITGVGPGMGSKLALESARAGASVALLARSTGLVDELVSAIGASGGKAIGIQCDVTKVHDCERAVAATLEAFGRIDGLVNSAYGMTKMLSVEDADLDQWRSCFEITLFGALNMVRAVLPAMKSAGGGAIVNVGTMETRRPLINNGAYNVPKSALQGATRQLAAELGQHKIRVNSAVIGWMWGKPVEDHMHAYAQQSGIPFEKLIEERTSHIPIGHIPPDHECAKSVLMLLSDYTSQVTGAAWDINGGEFFSM
ncbi:MAG TPA: SDR family oxidoreductase [Burkholderiaceae bacterium]|nr:SDR family oxidoreductase [Burkholderiaceae bacterium]